MTTERLILLDIIVGVAAVVILALRYGLPWLWSLMP